MTSCQVVLPTSLCQTLLWKRRENFHRTSSTEVRGRGRGGAHLACEIKVLEQNHQQRQSIVAGGRHHIRLERRGVEGCSVRWEVEFQEAPRMQG